MVWSKNKVTTLSQLLDHYPQIYDNIPLGFTSSVYEKMKFTKDEWVDLMDIYIELEETERSKIKDAAKKAWAEETLYGVWSKY